MNVRIKLLKQIVVVLLAVSFLNLNSSFAADVKSTSKTNVSKVAGAQLPSYLLGAGDILEISVWKEEGLQKEVLVRPDGRITYPLVGELMAGGKTVAQLEETIVKSIKRFIPDPVVNVSVLQIISNHIYVIGKVNQPRDFGAPSYINVMQALSMSGGLNPFAKAGDIKILRRVKGKQIAIPFDYDDVSKGKNLKQNIFLRNGDVVVVP